MIPVEKIKITLLMRVLFLRTVTELPIDGLPAFVPWKRWTAIKLKCLLFSKCRKNFANYA